MKKRIISIEQNRDATSLKENDFFVVDNLLDDNRTLKLSKEELFLAIKQYIKENTALLLKSGQNQTLELEGLIQKLNFTNAIIDYSPEEQAANIHVIGTPGPPGTISSAESITLAHIPFISEPDENSTTLYAKSDGKIYYWPDNSATEFQVLSEFVFPYGGLIENVSAKNYTLFIPDQPYRLRSLRIRSNQGSCRATFKINGIIVPELDNILVTTSTFYHALSDPIEALIDSNQPFSIDISNPSAIRDLEFTLMFETNNATHTPWSDGFIGGGSSGGGGGGGGTIKTVVIQDVTDFKSLNAGDAYFQYLNPLQPMVTINLPADLGENSFYEGEIVNTGDGTNALRIFDADSNLLITLSKSSSTRARAIYYHWDGTGWRIYENSFYREEPMESNPNLRFGSVFLEQPDLKSYTLFITPSKMKILSLKGIRTNQGTLTFSIRKNGENIPQLSGIMVNDNYKDVVVANDILIEENDIISLFINSSMETEDFELTFIAEIL